jgi:hypothetical protein
MSTNSQPPQVPPAQKKKVVVAPTVGGTGPSAADMAWAGVASIISLVVHAALIVLIMQFDLGGAGQAHASDFKERAPDQQDEPNKEEKADLTNEEVGLESDKPINYNVDLKADVSVPGVVSPNDPIGILNAPADAAPRSISAPPGTGQGTGGSLGVPDLTGTASPFGSPGGMNGMWTPGGFQGRSGATRQKLLAEYGGNERSEACVAQGLMWLALHQSVDGHWSLHEFNRHARTEPFPKGVVKPDNSTGMSSRKNDIAGTAFGLLPFLAGGQTHRPSKNSKVDYSKSVLAGLNYLKKKQNAEGYFGGDMYAHGLATIAICEAYGLTSDPTLKGPAQKAIDFIVSAQHEAGGWRYSPNIPGDLSVTGWQVMALKSGQMSGLNIKEGAWKKVESFLRSCEVHEDYMGRKVHSGGYSYMPGTGETPTMTAVGMLCSQYLGVTPRNPELIKGAEKLKKFPPNATKNLYYEYYATQVMHHMGGDAWKFWNEGPDGKTGIRDTLINKMDGGGQVPAHLGSWAQEGAGHVNDGGRIMATSLSLLTLEVYYRHLPLYRREMNFAKDEKLFNGDKEKK